MTGKEDLFGPAEGPIMSPVYHPLPPSQKTEKNHTGKLPNSQNNQ